MKLTTIFLTLASVCIGLALAALGNIYSGALLALAAIVVASTLKIRQYLPRKREAEGRQSTNPQPDAAHAARLMPWAVPAAIGILGGAALAFVAIHPNLLSLGTSASARPASHVSDDYRELELFGKVFDIVRADYVDKPNDQKLIASAVNGMVTGLDPHSNYMDAKNFKDMEVDTSGEFGGLGMVLSMDKGLAKVVSPIDNTPASRAGIMTGDVITKVDGQPISGLTLDKIVAKLRGPVGSHVTLDISRKKQTAPISVTLERQIIKVASVKYHEEGDDVGYIKITQFNNLAGNELTAAIKDITAKIPENKLKGYILDLRNNPGGLVDQAVAVCDTFLDRGEIVSLRGRNPDDSARYDAKAGDMTHGKPLIVLINGGSASASEIVAGALQDQKRATIIGTRSFGKGSVQTIIPLGSGNGALRLTTARYFTPSGRSIQAQGITPDIEVREQVPADIAARMPSLVSESTLRGHLKARGTEKKGSQAYVPPKEKNDRALQTALSLLRGTETNAAFPASQKQARAN